MVGNLAAVFVAGIAVSGLWRALRGFAFDAYGRGAVSGQALATFAITVALAGALA